MKKKYNLHKDKSLATKPQNNRPNFHFLVEHNFKKFFTKIDKTQNQKFIEMCIIKIERETEKIKLENSDKFTKDMCYQLKLQLLRLEGSNENVEVEQAKFWKKLCKQAHVQESSEESLIPVHQVLYLAIEEASENQDFYDSVINVYQVPKTFPTSFPMQPVTCKPKVATITSAMYVNHEVKQWTEQVRKILEHREISS